MPMITIGEVPARTYVSKSKIPGTDYVINPYVGCPHKCVYCYAEYMRKFSGHAEAWGDFLDVKRCPVPLKPAMLFRASVMLCSVTDPYNPYEQKYEVTRQALKQLLYCQANVRILTKSALVVRDIELFKRFTHFEAAVSFSSADESFRQLAEPGASPVEDKIIALKTLHESGLKTAVMMAPVFPGITDWKKIIALTRPYTDRYGFDSLNLRPAYHKRVMGFIAEHYPQHTPLYEEIYEAENPAYWQGLRAEIETYCRENNIPASIYFPHHGEETY